MDGYNWGTAQTKATHGYDSSFRSFAAIFGPLRDELRALAPDKPVMVFETASASTGGDKARWAAEAFDTAAAWGSGLWSGSRWTRNWTGHCARTLRRIRPRACGHT